MLQFCKAGDRALSERLVLVAPAADRSANRLDAAFRKAALFLALLLLAACGGGGGGGGGGGSGGSPALLVSIAISPARPTMTAGTTLQLNATGTYSDGTTQNLSGSVTWTSSVTQVATVTSNGLVSAVAAGSTLIAATLGGIGTNETVTVTAVPPAVTLTFIHNFGSVPGGGDGVQPNGPLLQASDGNFYTTTRAGGANSCSGFACGTIVRVTPAGSEAVMYSFGASATDGYGSSAPLIQGSDGALYGTTAFGGIHGAGTVFRITLAGAYTVLYSFGASASDGTVPVSALVQGSDGNFYGTTSNGGANHCANIPGSGGNCGTVFRLTPTGVETVLHSFGGSPSDGVEPLGSLIQGSDGNFYGTTIDGGANSCASGTHNCGTVFRITPAGVVTILHSFGTSPADGLAPQGPLIQGSDGAFYGTTPSGGGGTCGHQFGCGTVFRITPAGTVTILYAFATINGRSDGYGPSPFLTQAGDGNFYGTTHSGGAVPADSNGTVFRLTPSGVKTILYSFGPLNTNPSDPGAGVTAASDGAFYGVTSNSGQGHGLGTVFKLVVQ